MQKLKKSLRILSEKTGSNKKLSVYVHNKCNAKLGDSLVNFIYSVAKSLVSEIPTGVKVSDSILSEAYKGSLWYNSNSLKLKGKKSKIADAIEALILYFWIHEDISLEKLINPLMVQLKPDRLHHHKEEHASAVLSFQSLLDFLFQIYLE
ncbi:MAG: ribonuclease III family protein [Candidatus Hodarchaeales archaeon]